mmetsp:Transcript_31061/g.57549  ORF Transcript_31061/g.57549 Transcript_31061/m.57549 type:complete len:338 (+) Transcript_31061:961-1974(+)
MGRIAEGGGDELRLVASVVSGRFFVGNCNNGFFLRFGVQRTNFTGSGFENDAPVAPTTARIRRDSRFLVRSIRRRSNSRWILRIRSLSGGGGDAAIILVVILAAVLPRSTPFAQKHLHGNAPREGGIDIVLLHLLDGNGIVSLLSRLAVPPRNEGKVARCLPRPSARRKMSIATGIVVARLPPLPRWRSSSIIQHVAMIRNVDTLLLLGIHRRRRRTSSLPLVVPARILLLLARRRRRQRHLDLAMTRRRTRRMAVAVVILRTPVKEMRYVVRRRLGVGPREGFRPRPVVAADVVAAAGATPSFGGRDEPGRRPALLAGPVVGRAVGARRGGEDVVR